MLLRLIPLLIIFVLIALFAQALLKEGDINHSPSVLIGQPAPRVGWPLALQNSGKPFLINFFASWCLPCAAEQETLMTLAKQNNIPLYGVNYKDTRKEAKAWLAKHGNPYQGIVIDPTGTIALSWGITGVPETFVIDAKGIVRLRFAGPLTMDAYRREIQPILQEETP